MAIWAYDELLVLLAFYFRYPRPSHTDSHSDCQLLASVLGRSPAAVDHQLRNIDFDLIRATADRHVSRRLSELLDSHRDNLPHLYRQANEALERNGWVFPRF